MKTFLILCMVFTGHANAKDLEESKLAGKAIFVKNCINCHGFPGRFLNAPHLYGQDQKYLKVSLERFKSGVRKDRMMSKMMNYVAGQLTNENIDDLANYISTESRCKNAPNGLIADGDPVRGRKFYEGSYCKLCHAEKSGSIGPNVLGQKGAFVALTISHFKKGLRDNPNMYGLVQHFEDQDIIDIGSYLSSVSVCQ